MVRRLGIASRAATDTRIRNIIDEASLVRCVAYRDQIRRSIVTTRIVEVWRNASALHPQRPSPSHARPPVLLGASVIVDVVAGFADHEDIAAAIGRITKVDRSVRNHDSAAADNPAAGKSVDA